MPHGSIMICTAVKKENSNRLFCTPPLNTDARVSGRAITAAPDLGLGDCQNCFRGNPSDLINENCLQIFHYSSKIWLNAVCFHRIIEFILDRIHKSVCTSLSSKGQLEYQHNGHVCHWYSKRVIPVAGNQLCISAKQGGYERCD